MTVGFTKSLDRPVDIFGLKGKWIIVFLILVGVGLFAGLVVGFSTTSGIGISFVIISLVVAFVACLLMQGKVSHRQIGKYLSSSKIYPAVLRRERLNYILGDKQSEPSWFNAAQTARDEAVKKNFSCPENECADVTEISRELWDILSECGPETDDEHISDDIDLMLNSENILDDEREGA